MKKIILLLLLINFNLISQSLEVIYPNRDGLGEKAYGFQLLKLILAKTGKNYSVKVAKQESNQDRALFELKHGRYSVVDTGIGPEMEKNFDTIYIPIDMGLTGWRIFIINESQKSDFKKIETLDQLKKKVAGQGIGWTDGLIIERAGIKVETSAKIENLINMVDSGRFDFFPLGVNETHGFLAQYGQGKANLIVEDTLVLVYPFGRFFYVKKGNETLKNDIILGLEKAYEDGSFKNFLENHPFYKEGLSKSNLSKRKVIRIPNPFVSKEFNNIDKKWWYKVK